MSDTPSTAPAETRCAYCGLVFVGKPICTNRGTYFCTPARPTPAAPSGEREALDHDTLYSLQTAAECDVTYRIAVAMRPREARVILTALAAPSPHGEPSPEAARIADALKRIGNEASAARCDHLDDLDLHDLRAAARLLLAPHPEPASAELRERVAEILWQETEEVVYAAPGTRWSRADEEDPETAAACRRAAKRILALLSPTPEQSESLEIRRNEDGSVDEIVGHGFLHLEQLDTGMWFLGGPKGLHATLHSGKPIRCRVDEPRNAPAETRGRAGETLNDAAIHNPREFARAAEEAGIFGEWEEHPDTSEEEV